MKKKEKFTCIYRYERISKVGWGIWECGFIRSVCHLGSFPTKHSRIAELGVGGI